MLVLPMLLILLPLLVLPSAADATALSASRDGDAVDARLLRKSLLLLLLLLLLLWLLPEAAGARKARATPAVVVSTRPASIMTRRCRWP